MILLIFGASHTGKTVLAQRLMEQRHIPYLSIDHLKMGLIRSGTTALTPSDDDALTAYLWPIVREMIKTAIENRQNLIVEGCYIPFSWRDNFSEEYLREIRHCCLVMTGGYIRTHWAEIRTHGSDIEYRGDDDCSPEWLIRQNERNLRLCRQHDCNVVLIDEHYDISTQIQEIFS